MPPRTPAKRQRFHSPVTPSPRRPARDHLIQGSPQIIVNDHDVEDVIDEAIEEYATVRELIDVATADGPAAVVDHIIHRQAQADEQMNDARHNIRFAHRRGRHFLPLNPGILIC